jgi:uncharacterized ParB-like nuclease family protein
MQVEDIPLKQIHRPLPRGTDPTKVEALMKSMFYFEKSSSLR